MRQLCGALGLPCCLTSASLLLLPVIAAAYDGAVAQSHATQPKAEPALDMNALDQGQSALQPRTLSEQNALERIRALEPAQRRAIASAIGADPPTNSHIVEVLATASYSVPFAMQLKGMRDDQDSRTGSELRSQARARRVILHELRRRRAAYTPAEAAAVARSLAAKRQRVRGSARVADAVRRAERHLGVSRSFTLQWDASSDGRADVNLPAPTWEERRCNSDLSADEWWQMTPEAEIVELLVLAIDGFRIVPAGGDRLLDEEQMQALGHAFTTSGLGYASGPNVYMFDSYMRPRYSKFYTSLRVAGADTLRAYEDSIVAACGGTVPTVCDADPTQDETSEAPMVSQ